MADDTGLEVEALDGAPGVYSARFAGEHATYADNVAKLLASWRRWGPSTPSGRRARFRTVALVAYPDGSERWAEGEVAGTISASPRGEHGFGYDPIFVPDGGDGRTLRGADRRREARDLPPGAGVPGPGRDLTGGPSTA